MISPDFCSRGGYVINHDFFVTDIIAFFAGDYFIFRETKHTTNEWGRNITLTERVSCR